MRALSTATVLSFFLLLAAPAQSAAKGDRPDQPGLSELMVATQFQHIKLWFAGRFGNWKLATYELDQLASSLDQAARRLPAGATPAPAASELSSLRNSIQAKDLIAFTSAYTRLTNGCNACHRAVGREFISVQVPPNSPFTDQIFADQVEEGRRLAHTICGTCHVVPDSVNAAPAGLPAPSFAEVARRPSLTEESLRQLLASDHRRLGPDQKMPNPRLTEAQIEQIVAYFEALKAEQHR